jgi:hypothetical protein
MCLKKPSELPDNDFCSDCAPDKILAEAIWAAAKRADEIGLDWDEFNEMYELAFSVTDLPHLPAQVAVANFSREEETLCPYCDEKPSPLNQRLVPGVRHGPDARSVARGGCRVFEEHRS